MSPLERFSKWLQLKIYQFEVTFAIYIFTPVEKFIIYSVLFLLFSLTTIAMVLYLPQHVQFIMNRAWFYMHGDAGDFGPAGGILSATKHVSQAVAAVTLGSPFSDTVEAVAAATARVVEEL